MMVSHRNYVLNLVQFALCCAVCTVLWKICDPVGAERGRTLYFTLFQTVSQYGIQIWCGPSLIKRVFLILKKL